MSDVPTPDVPIPDVPIPDVPTPDVPDFDLIRPIGSGGFGRVWLAANRTTGHLRAVKLIPLRHGGETDRAGREISSITRLEKHVRTDHPSLLKIHHVGRTDEHLFYIMDPADDVTGGRASRHEDYRPATLQSRLQFGPLPPALCLEVARRLLEGLASLHAAGMVHRDVKPANCLFVDGKLKLADFGLLTAAGPQVSRMGTEKYMPPDGRMDTRADVYAAGLVIYEMLTGLPADDFPSLGEPAREIAADPIRTRLNRLVLQACEPNPQQRFADARAMLAELDRPIPPPVPRRRRIRRRTIVTAACVLVAGSAATIALWPEGVTHNVDVNFISHPYEATIYLDGKPLLDSSGRPEKTPCTAEHLPPRTHHVIFKHPGRPDLDAGRFNFAKTREIEVRW